MNDLKLWVYLIIIMVMGWAILEYRGVNDAILFTLLVAAGAFVNTSKLYKK